LRRFSIYWSLCENGFEKFYFKFFSNYQTYLSNLLRRRSIKKFWLTFWQQDHFLSRESNSSQILVVTVWMVTVCLFLWVEEILSNLVNQLSLYLFDLHSVKYLSRCSLFLVLNTKWDCSFSCFQGRHMLEIFSLFCSLHLISLSYFVLPKLHWIKLNKKSVSLSHPDMTNRITTS